ncbi:hypothetical protein L3Y34_019434 [Caenorhabditis briggsae]|uniref:RING-type domain-containing protein n=1 Tax=Caenorhabditis briggsae TaxID=6238 RepID=A0AAE9DMT3_CAEBR|nr:hypothetical protein L3Y34_019434 [Caenorhabditis briggsae]
MIHLESLICYSCQTSHNQRNLFDDKDRRAIVGTCGHSICLTCSISDENRDCPICTKPNAFIHRTVNYEAMTQMEYYRTNAFTTFRKWWETLATGVGVCSTCASIENLRICLTCQKAQNLKDQNLSKDVMCPPCADNMMRRTAGDGYVHQCDSTPVLQLIRNPSHCYKCGEDTDDPRICEKCFHVRTMNVNVDTFSVCADCILEHHGGHQTTKAVEEYGIRHCTVDIINKLLLIKLDCLTDKKCKLRKMRLDLIGRDAIYWASLHYPLYTEENCPEPKLIGRPIIKEKVIERIIDCLEDQYNQLEELKEICGCVEVYRDVERLNLFDWHECCPHLRAMTMKPDTDVKIDRCPFDLESSQEWRRQLLEIIERNEVATEPLESIYVMREAN